MIAVKYAGGVMRDTRRERLSQTMGLETGGAGESGGQEVLRVC